MSQASSYPRYKCHKIVSAFQIGGIGVSVIQPLDPTLPPFTPGAGFLMDHPDLVVGDYIVFYEDGYFSRSPQKPFEEGYTLIKEED